MLLRVTQLAKAPGAAGLRLLSRHGRSAPRRTAAPSSAPSFRAHALVGPASPRSRPGRRLLDGLGHLACAAVLVLSGCTCSSLRGSAEGLKFVRCSQIDSAPERILRAAGLSLHQKERVLTVSAQGPLRMAAFQGPVGSPLGRGELEALAADEPQLIVVLGGLGDSTEQVQASVQGLAELGVPVLFVPGGADRLQLFEDAVESLDEHRRRFIYNGAALRELRVGKDRFAIVPGAPGGRYALDEESCGFGPDDLKDVAEAFQERRSDERIWLLSWAAPAGRALTRGAFGHDLGDPQLAQLARSIDARGGLFAFPEGGPAEPSEAAAGLSLLVPRLGRSGTTLTGGGRLASAVARLAIDPDGLSLR